VAGIGRWTKLALVAGLMVAGLATAGPNRGIDSGRMRPDASVGPTPFTNINLTTDSCAGVNGSLSVTVTGTVDDGGGNDVVWFTIFDDNIEKFAQQISVPVGTTTTTVVNVNYPGGVGGSAPGIGLLLGETRGDDNLIDVDPFFPTATGGTCLGTQIPTTSGSTLLLLAALIVALSVPLLRRRSSAKKK
jgi:hypothetical protein